MANPWEQNAEPINNPAATSMQGASAPSNVSANDTTVPWHQDHAPINNPAGDGQGGSVWESIKANMGARVDALAAGMLQDEGSDRSRYAMKRAERSNQEARVQESQLSTMQKVGVGAADIGTGLAMSAVPGVGPELTAAYFGAQGTADQLRQQAEEGGRYDVQKAADVGIAQGAAGVGAGQAAGALVGKLLPTVADKFAGQLVTNATGGAGGGASMQMISNIANGKDITEGVGESALQGAIGGAGAHAIAPAVRAVARAPKTLRDIQDAGAADFARKNPNINLGEEAPVEQPQAAPVVAAEEGAIPTGAEPIQGGAIPTPESQWVPGSENLNPNEYGEYKGPTRLQPGQGFGPGAPQPRNPDTIPEDVAAAPRRGVHMAQHLWDTFRKEGLTGLVSPKGVKQMSDAELTTEKLGLKADRSLVNQAKETEGTVDILQQQLESLPVGSPEYQQHVNAINNLTMESGSAAAHTRANALALDTGMPMTSKFHDITLTEGVNNERTPRNIARDVHGMSSNDINAEHRAVLESRGSSIVGSKAEEQAEKYQTFESHYNATNKAYKMAKQKVDNAFNDNYELAMRTREQLSRSEQPELYQRAQDLTNALDDLRQLKTQVSNGDPINTNKLATIQRQIIDHGTALGLTPKFKNVLGEAGTFNPTLDLQAWHNFNTRTRQMHTNAPKGNFKDTVAKGDIGLEGVDITKPASWVKPVKNVVTSAAKRHESVMTQAKGAAMAKEAAQRPERASEEHIQEQLKQGNTESATEASNTALNESGINTEGPTLATTPAEEVQAAAPAPEVNPAIQAHMDTLLRGAQGMVDARNAEAAANRAARPAAPAEPEVAPEAAPVEEVPQGPGPMAEGNVRPAQLQEPEVQQALEEHAPTPAEMAHEQAHVEQAPEAPVEQPKPYEGVRKPKVNTPEPVVEEASQARGEGVPQKPKAAVKPEAEEAPREPTQEETPATDKPVTEEVTDFKTNDEGKVSETPEQRNKRVSDMAKRMIQEKTEEVIKKPMKALSKDHTEALKQKAKAEGMRKGINDILAHSKDIADKEGVHQADVMHAIMSREGGIESMFSDGFGKDAIKGRMNTAVKAYKTERRQMAKQVVNDASEIVRDHLGKAKVGETREAADDRIRANLKSMGLEDKVIQGAFKQAAEAGNGNYTARHVVNYARQIMKGIRAEANAAKPADSINHVANSREQLHKHIDSLGVDSFTRSALRKVVANHTQVGATGKRGALTEAETKAVMADITKTLAERAAEAKAALSKKPAGSPAAKTQSEKVSKIEAAQDKAEQTRGSIESDLANVRESEAKAKEAQKASEKRAQEAEAKFNELSSKMDDMVKTQEANTAKAIADAKSEMRKEIAGMPTDQVEEVGKVVGEDLPDSVGSSSDPDYLNWKAKMELASEELGKRGLKADSNFLRHFTDMVDKGLKRLEELPDHRDLVITQTEYNQLRDMYNKVKKGGDLDVEESGNVQMGTMGIKLRTLLLGDANARNKIRYNSDRLNAERRKALAEKEGTGDFGEGSPDIVAKPAKTEAALTPKEEVKPKAAKTEAEVAYAKQKAKITRMQKKLNDDRYWALNDDEYGRKWKAHRGAVEHEKSVLAKMPKK